MVTKQYNKVKVKDNMQVDSVKETEEGIEPTKIKLQRLVDVQPQKVKRNLFSRLVKGFLGEEGLSGIGTYVNEEIIIPAIKHMIVDGITSGINMVIYGENRPRRGDNHSRSRNRTVYRPQTNYRTRYEEEREPRERIARPATYGVDEYKLDDRISATHVLTTLVEHADRYDVVAVSDYYDLIGVPTEFTDENYGWTIDSITRAIIVPVRGGYVIKFPAVEVI